MRLISLLPAGGPAWLARRLVGLWMALSPGKRAVARTNLQRCFPALDDEARERLVRDSFEHYICAVLETGRNWYWPMDRLLALCEATEGREILESALAADRGLLVLAPHFGAWECLGLCLQTTCDMAILYKRPSHAGFARALLKHRGRAGGQMVAASPAGLRQLVSHLRDGKCAGVLPDQEPSVGQGRFAPFFGVPALTGVLAPRLAQKTRSRMLFAVCERRPAGRFRIHVLEADDAVYSDDIDTAVAAINRGVERCIAIDPAQYLWSYKRFRSRPPGERRFYT